MTSTFFLLSLLKERDFLTVVVFDVFVVVVFDVVSLVVVVFLVVVSLVVVVVSFVVVAVVVVVVVEVVVVGSGSTVPGSSAAKQYKGIINSASAVQRAKAEKVFNLFIRNSPSKFC